MTESVRSAGATDKVRWLDDAEQRSWRSILRAYHLLDRAMQTALDDHTVSVGEYELLSMVSEAPGGRMRMAELAQLVVQSRSRVSHTATRLEKRGWVRRERILEDGRGVALALTAEGRERITELAEVHVTSVRTAFLDHLTREELIGYGDVMRRVVRATRRDEGEARDAT